MTGAADDEGPDDGVIERVCPALPRRPKKSRWVTGVLPSSRRFFIGLLSTLPRPLCVCVCEGAGYSSTCRSPWRPSERTCQSFPPPRQRTWVRVRDCVCAFPRVIIDIGNKNNMKEGRNGRTHRTPHSLQFSALCSRVRVLVRIFMLTFTFARVGMCVCGTHRRSLGIAAVSATSLSSSGHPGASSSQPLLASSTPTTMMGGGGGVVTRRDDHNGDTLIDNEWSGPTNRFGGGLIGPPTKRLRLMRRRRQTGEATPVVEVSELQLWP
eukprot:GHVU01181202.1.p1 GENE.GHVU01181202.1~~GHVU01181202.1.p1  ORF type:complete len:267 (-),score=28.80 GHVU01181202.1:214-1014(-)